MRCLALCLLLSLAPACGPRTRAGTVAAGGACQHSAQCPIGHACVGCTAETLTCLPGCESDEDCAIGTCGPRYCVTCPCPGECSAK